jgi:hypothetical protein
MNRKITIAGTVYTADVTSLTDYRVTVKGGNISVSPDLETETPGAEFEAAFYGRERINIISAPEDFNYSIGKPEYGPGESPLTEAKAKKLAEIAAARYAEEVGGITFSGMAIDTSRESQGLITGAALQATIDPAYMCRWKTAGGFVELGAEAVIAVAVAVREHVQGCFDREAELTSVIESAETIEAAEAVSWRNG